MSKETDKLLEVDDDLKSFYKEAFDDFDWNKNGRITCRVLISAQNAFLKIIFLGATVSDA